MVTPTVTHDTAALQQQLIEALAAAKEREGRGISDEEHQWVKLAIQREAQSIKLRQAIIEKTLTGLAWLCVLGLFALIKEYAGNHGWRA